jgi:very-short-patch-repair endonuclease
VVVDGLRVTTPARTVMDLAATMPLGLVARALDRAWGQHLLSLGALGTVLAEVRTRGRRGVHTIEMLLEERIGQTPAESGLEYRMSDIAKRFGLGPLRRQVDVFDEEGWIARVDFVHEHRPLAVLIDGDAWHRAVTQVAADDLESRRLRAAGLDVVRVSELEVLYDERTVVRRMRAALERPAAAA